MDTIETIDVIKCPDCESISYLSYQELYDDEWISLQCNCLTCKAKFQINYRAVGIDIIGPDREQREIKRQLRKIFLDLLKRDRDLRIKYDQLIDSECEENKLKEIVKYLLNEYSPAFEDKLLPGREEKEKYLADAIQVLYEIDP
ncbi:MAG TPA: hypothetical protein DHV62_07830 [Elusimicrobia bacterium]|jgi:hypothetical protein|nr:hypothetical protein [Elusimicrobiota bacterium]